ncbi:hypothetical protein [Actinocorallia longicatena]|uniref:hypothetical protein n=1 Tax=Actinocorallia longicatena TaxID=111803 RepID=UPI0031E3B929
MTVIAACEVAFWVVLGLGLFARYGLRKARLGGVLLLLVPVVDLVLLGVTTADLKNGGEIGIAHGLAAVYLGVSVGFGHQIIRRMDAWAAHRFDGAPRPARPPKYGRERAAHEARQWSRHLLAWAVGCGLLGLAILHVGDAARTEVLGGLIRLWTLVLGIDAAVSFSYTLAPKRAKGVER